MRLVREYYYPIESSGHGCTEDEEVAIEAADGRPYASRWALVGKWKVSTNGW